MDALVDEAHALDMKVYVHAVQLVDTRMSVLAGADSFVHATMDAPVAAAVLDKLRAQRMVWSPALGSILIMRDYRRYARRVLADEVLTASLSGDQLSDMREYSQAAS